MIVSYDKLWKLMIDRQLKKTELVHRAGISSNAMARVGRRQPVTLECIAKICRYLQCTVDDILVFQWDE